MLVVRACVRVVLRGRHASGSLFACASVFCHRNQQASDGVTRASEELRSLRPNPQRWASHTMSETVEALGSLFV